MSSTIEQTDSCKPAGLISGKRCGLAAVHNPPRLQAELDVMWTVPNLGGAKRLARLLVKG
jgi:hypothetical protein